MGKNPRHTGRSRYPVRHILIYFGPILDPGFRRGDEERRRGDEERRRGDEK